MAAAPNAAREVFRQAEAGRERSPWRAGISPARHSGIPAVERLVTNGWVSVAAWDPAGDGLAWFDGGAFVPHRPECRTLARVAREREDLDLRRIEHVLIEIRDGQRRLEDSLLRASQLAHHGDTARGVPSADAAGISERIVQRLHAHGFEHVQVVPTLEELAKLLESGGAHEVLVEARRAGVQCKGRVLVRDGVVLEVEVKPAYSMFP